MIDHTLGTRSVWHLAALLGIAGYFLVGGIGHYIWPRLFVAIVPGYVPLPRMAVAVSGALEFAGAVAILIPRSRRLAGIGLMLLILAVFPANVHMALNPGVYSTFAPWLLYARLPLQLLLLVWVAYAMRGARPVA